MVGNKGFVAPEDAASHEREATRPLLDMRASDGPRFVAMLRLSRALGWVLAALGLSVLLGWLLGVPLLTRVYPGMPSMKAYTAFAFVLLGVAQVTDSTRAYRLCGSTVLALTLLTWLEYALERSLGLTWWRTAGAGPLEVQARMSPSAAIGCALLAVGLMCRESRRLDVLRQATTLLAGALAFLALCGYLYDVRSLYTLGPYASMALHTSMGILLCSVSLLCRRPDAGVMMLLTSNSSSGLLVRRLLPALVLVPMGLGWLRLAGQDAGLYDTRFGVALLVLSSVLGLTTLTVFIATTLHRSERAHKRALDELAQRERELAQGAERLAFLAERLGAVIGESCVVRLIAADGRHLELTGSVYHPDPELQKVACEMFALSPQRLGEGPSGRSAETGETIRLANLDPATFSALAPERYRPMVERLGITSSLTVPLKANGRVLGIINLSRGRGKPPYSLADQRFAEDIADRAALALENASLLAELERRVSVRTAELENANRELETFSYSVSHDLRSPLRAIDGFSQALLQDYGDRLDPQAQHYLSRIRAGTTRMSALIDDLLNLARIGREEVRKEELDLCTLASAVVEELKKREPARQLEVELGTGLKASGDPRLLCIVLENLLGNAFKFTSKTAEARVQVGCEEQAGERVFFVRDNGAGFDMALAERLFSPFHRLHHRSDFEGTGVGLATVQRIVTHHGGRVWAHAEVGRGATFFFTLGEAR
jgi:signal transduction histidine kinase